MREKTSSLSLIHLFLSLLLMALISFLPNSTPNNTNATISHSPRHKTKTKNPNTNSKSTKKKKAPPLPPPPKVPSSSSSSWEQFKSLLSCKNTTTPSQVHAPSPIIVKYAKLTSTCGSSICAIRDVVHATTRVTDNGSSSDSGSHVNDSTPLSARSARSTTSAAMTSSRGGMQLMKLSGCYECHAVDVHSASRRYPRPRTLCPCAECGEVFTKTDSLELHQAIRHAVSELGPEDSGRNIVEIIFKSSWQKKENPICTIERILKVHNTQRTITRFEEYRDAVKARAQAHLNPSQPKSKNPRCAADGNELLRFHSTSLSCSLGSNNSTSLCLASSANSSPCSVCTIIRYGFSRAHQSTASAGPQGVRTTASSGRAHDWGPGPAVDGGPDGRRRAMLVCRVIAGRVKRCGDLDIEGSGPFDSVAGDGSLEELFVANPRAILPCFVVIYKALD